MAQSGRTDGIAGHLAGDITGRLLISAVTLGRWIREGRFPLPDVRVGRTRIWRPETIDAWVARSGEQGRGAGGS
jgi:predicted site-specific integrase-resolvase